jgi:hypothetical protein
VPHPVLARSAASRERTVGIAWCRSEPAFQFRNYSRPQLLDILFDSKKEADSGFPVIFSENLSGGVAT